MEIWYTVGCKGRNSHKNAIIFGFQHRKLFRWYWILDQRFSSMCC